MLLLPEARLLLENSRNISALQQSALALGFSRPTPVEAELQEKLRIAGLAEEFSVAEGTGALRILLVAFRPGTDPRDSLSLIARRLASSVPHLFWLMLSTDQASHTGVSVWRSEADRPRVFTLLADRSRISESDVQAFCALASIHTTSDLLTHLRWTEILGREAIGMRFSRALQSVTVAMADSLQCDISSEKANEAALLCVSRLLFLSFIESKGWLDRDFDFLSNSFIQCMTAGGNYHKTVLVPLFFGTLNTPASHRAPRARRFGRIPFLNGGLFARNWSERSIGMCFSDEAIGRVYGDLLTRFRFTSREQSSAISESAIDPEMLGRAFESLMANDVRKSSGAFYTPHSVVEQVSNAALESVLERAGVSPADVAQVSSGYALPRNSAHRVLKILDQIRIIDPACGSGAFLVYLLERISGIRALAGDGRAACDRRRQVLTNAIFGVDISPTAVWLCELRLWLSVVVETDIDDPNRVLPLPNLDRNIRVGDSIGGKLSGSACMTPALQVERLRKRYVGAVGARKKIIVRLLERAERRHAVELLHGELATIAAQRSDLINASRSRDLFGQRSLVFTHRDSLLRLRDRKREAARSLLALRKGGALPFSFETHFPEVMSTGGFHLVAGNPPWVRIHQIARRSRQLFRQTFEVCRSGGWREGATQAGAASGFANQLDLSALFVERSAMIVREGGTIALLIPVKLWKSLAGGAVRALISRQCDVRTLEDFSEARAVFDAAAYPSLLVCTRKRRSAEVGITEPHAGITAAVHRRTDVLRWQMSPDMLPLDSTTGAPWLLIPEEVRAGFDALRLNGNPLALTSFGRPILGVKTGCNAAFIVEVLEQSERAVRVQAEARTGTIEAGVLRKIVRGDAIEPWRIRSSQERIIWTHDANGDPVETLPAMTREWMRHWRHVLARRSDARSDTRWWRVFRTESADHRRPRVVWADIGRIPRAAVIEAGDWSVPLNSCYVIPCPTRIDAYALAALLNSPLVGAWLSVLAEPAQGSYKRYLGWTMACLPIPRDWNRVKPGLSRLYKRALTGEIPTPAEVFEKTAKCYEVPAERVQALMVWTAS